MPIIDTVQSDVRTSAISPLAARQKEQDEEKTKAELAREAARQPGPKELARDKLSPVSNNEFPARTEELRRDNNNPEPKRELEPATKDLVAIRPKDELEVFEDKSASESKSEPTTQTKEFVKAELETTGFVKDKSVSDTTASDSSSQVTKPEEVTRTESTKLSAEIEVYLEAIQNVAAQPTPVKAGDLLDIAV